MRYSSKTLPPNILEKMPKADRPKGVAGMTTPEIDAKNALKLERQIQSEIAQWLNLHEIYFIQAPFGKKSCLPTGHPDFTIFKSNMTFAIEVKRPGLWPDDDQKKAILRLLDEGVYTGTAHSLQEVIELLKKRGAI
jgi:hypothetical protein